MVDCVCDNLRVNKNGNILGNLNLNGKVGIGTSDLIRPLQVVGSSEIHSGGPGAGFSFASRKASSVVENPTKGERWVWYSDEFSPGNSTARLWSGKDLISIDSNGSLYVNGVIIGKTNNGEAIHGETNAAANAAIGGYNLNPQGGPGVWGSSINGEAIHGETKSPNVAAIAGFNLNPQGVGAAIYGKKEGEVGHAGFFDGKVYVTRTLTVQEVVRLKNGDCAEDFEIADADLVEPGTVMILGEEGVLHQSHQAYDKRVAGVISGAGDYKPGIVLDKQESQLNRKPIALLGKVYCKVDADYTPIEMGDLLTTAPTPGHAMKAIDSVKAFGAVIGKALKPLNVGCGLIPILVALQ